MDRLTSYVWPLLRRTLLGFILGGAPAVVVGMSVAWAVVPCAVAQVSVSPSAVEASLSAGETSEIALTVVNEGGASVELFPVPLPRGALPEEPPGTLLFWNELHVNGNPYDIAMTSAGQLFINRFGGVAGYAWEFTAELDSLRFFEHPHAGNTSRTTGVTWMPPELAPPGYPEGTLWWLDVVVDCNGTDCAVESTLLIEGGFDGNATGRTIEVVTGPGTLGPPTYDRGLPFGLTFDAEGELFYYLDALNEDIYAIDVNGDVAEGYPGTLIDYDPEDENELLEAGLDVSRGADGGQYLDYGVVLPGENGYERVAVTDRLGQSTGVETPLDLLYAPDGQGEVIRVIGVLRSRLDPSVMYVTALTGTTGPPTGKWIFAIRAHPLPPRWLRVAPVAPASLALAPGETDTVAVRLDAEGLAPGVYEGQVALREGGPNGEEAVAVPVVLTVTEGTAAEEGAAVPGAPSLAVYPNPAAGVATVRLSLAETADVRVAVFDVLGREVAVLHDGPLAAGGHVVSFEAAGLPGGVYVMRATGTGVAAAQRVTLVR